MTFKFGRVIEILPLLPHMAGKRDRDEGIRVKFSMVPSSKVMGKHPHGMNRDIKRKNG